MSVAKEFEKCQYEESDEYKLKKAIQDYCNNEDKMICYKELQEEEESL